MHLAIGFVARQRVSTASTSRLSITVTRGTSRFFSASSSTSRLASTSAYSGPFQRPLGHSSIPWRGSSPAGPMFSGKQRIHTSPLLSHNAITRPKPGTGIKVHWQDAKGNPIRTTEVNEGDNLLDIAHEYDIDLEGACEGSVACSTCHVILSSEHYDQLPEPEDEENDMLDMAFGLTDTSRLGCQVKITPTLDGIEVRLPSATRNMFVDGVKPTKH